MSKNKKATTKGKKAAADKVVKLHAAAHEQEATPERKAVLRQAVERINEYLQRQAQAAAKAGAAAGPGATERRRRAREQRIRRMENDMLAISARCPVDKGLSRAALLRDITTSCTNCRTAIAQAHAINDFDEFLEQHQDVPESERQQWTQDSLPVVKARIGRRAELYRLPVRGLLENDPTLQWLEHHLPAAKSNDDSTPPGGQSRRASIIKLRDAISVHAALTAHLKKVFDETLDNHMAERLARLLLGENVEGCVLFKGSARTFGEHLLRLEEADTYATLPQDKTLAELLAPKMKFLKDGKRNQVKEETITRGIQDARGLRLKSVR